MVQTTAEARQQLLGSLGDSIREIGSAIASLSAAYEQLDVARADELEEKLFRPLQLAYGRAKRTHAAFASRYGLTIGDLEPRSAGLPSTGVRGFMDNAVVAIERADHGLAELQDSLLPVDVGDPELRAALADLRELIGNLPGRARGLVRVIGR